MSAQKKSLKRCYNCGREFTDDNKETVEHIPMQALYAGYSSEYKNNRITVPGCYTCNHEYAKIDQELRDFIGIINNDNDSQLELTAKAVRNITRVKDFWKRLSLLDGGLEVEFNLDSLAKIHKKHFKGLFYHKYRIPLSKEYEIRVIADGDEHDSKLVEYVNIFHQQLGVEPVPWLASGHKDIFQYRLATLRCDGGDIYKVVDDVPNGSDWIICEMIYHKERYAMCLAAKTKFLPPKTDKMSNNGAKEATSR